MRLPHRLVFRCTTTSLVLRHVAIIATLLVDVTQASPAGATPMLYTLEGVTADFGSPFGTATITGSFTADPTVINSEASAAPTMLTVTGLDTGPPDFNQTYARAPKFLTTGETLSTTEVEAFDTAGDSIALFFAPRITASTPPTATVVDLVDSELTVLITGLVIREATPAPVPEPSGLWLLGAAIALFSLLRRCVTVQGTRGVVSDAQDIDSPRAPGVLA